MENKLLKGENIRPKTIMEARSLIGKKVLILEEKDIDKSGRGYFFPRESIIINAHGRNIELDGGHWVAYSSIAEMSELL